MNPTKIGWVNATQWYKIAAGRKYFLFGAFLWIIAYLALCDYYYYPLNFHLSIISVIFATLYYE